LLCIFSRLEQLSRVEQIKELSAVDFIEGHINVQGRVLFISD
jgi:hypothetical protein